MNAMTSEPFRIRTPRLARTKFDMRMSTVFANTCLAIALSVCAGSASQAADANFQRCLANDRGCDAARLQAGERSRILDRYRQMHLEDCLAGLRCKHGALTADQLRDVRKTTAARNFQSCLKGDASCDRSILADEQRDKVELAHNARNYEFCLGGLTACDPGALSDTQRAAVRTAYLERNYRGCMNAVGTLVRCDPDDLSTEQRDRVRRRTLEANLAACMTGLFGCDDRLLTPEQRARLAFIAGQQ